MAKSFITQVAESTPFDNETNGFVSEDVQAAIEEARKDQHAGWYDIIAGQVVTVETRKQMRINGIITLTGTLVIDGQTVID